MKKAFSALCIATSLLTGCASYRTSSLSKLSSEMIISPQPKAEVLLAAKIFDRADCKRYLDRDVITKGYQPLQLYIENNSNEAYLFSLDKISLPHAEPEEVARTVHTSTVGRVLAYGIPGLVILWPLLIPAVVDGIKSSEANEALDIDFRSKTASNHIIDPHSNYNKILFVPAEEFHSNFTITLIEENSREAKTFAVVANSS